MLVKIKPTASDEIDAAIELVCDMAFQNTTDRYDNPSRYKREIDAINLVRETFLRRAK